MPLNFFFANSPLLSEMAQWRPIKSISVVMSEGVAWKNHSTITPLILQGIKTGSTFSLKWPLRPCFSNGAMHSISISISISITTSIWLPTSCPNLLYNISAYTTLRKMGYKTDTTPPPKNRRWKCTVLKLAAQPPRRSLDKVYQRLGPRLKLKTWHRPFAQPSPNFKGMKSAKFEVYFRLPSSLWYTSGGVPPYRILEVGWQKSSEVKYKLCQHTWCGLKKHMG